MDEKDVKLQVALAVISRYGPPTVSGQEQWAVTVAKLTKIISNEILGYTSESTEEES